MSSASPTRSAFSRAMRASMSAERASVLMKWLHARMARIRDERASSWAASARASSESSSSVGRSALKVLTSSRSTSDRSTPDGTSVRSCSRIAAAISPLPARRWYVAARMRRCRASVGSSGVSSAASSQSSAAAEGAPRAAACSAAVSSSDATAASGPSAASPRWRARSSESVTTSASVRCTARRFQTGACPYDSRGEQGMRKANVRVVELDDAFVERPPPAPPALARGLHTPP